MNKKIVNEINNLLNENINEYVTKISKKYDINKQQLINIWNEFEECNICFELDRLQVIKNDQEINDNTQISGKYKTIGELKNIKLKYASLVISKMKCGKTKEYISKWFFEKNLKPFYGNLSSRIKNINNNACYTHIINHCFDGINSLQTLETIKPILNDKCKNIINELHNIDSSGTGTFIDYLIRRIISEIRNTKFYDTRASKIINLDGFSMKNDKQINDKQIWEFNTNNCESSITRWTIHSEPCLNSNAIDFIKNGYKFIELERKDEWLKIKYNETIGWVRYLVPDVDLLIQNNINIKDYINNKYFIKIEIDNDDYNHFCKAGCKRHMEKCLFYVSDDCDDDIRECLFPLCQNMCYIKVQDTENYETKDILKEIYITSCCHAESFFACPQQEKFDKIIKILDKIDIDFIYNLNKLCKSLVLNSKNVILNPVLGSDETPIPADCDLVIDDTLIDIKCTSKNKNIIEQLQLLGYTSMLKHNKKYNIHINNICIINLLECECKIYNIENITYDNLLEYLNLLTNKYDNKKQIFYKSKIYKPCHNPLFVNSIKIIEKELNQNKKTIIIYFPFINISKLDLSKYQIYNQEQLNYFKINNRKIENCLIWTLRQYDINEAVLNEVKLSLKNGSYIKKIDLIKICPIIKNNIRLHTYSKNEQKIFIQKIIENKEYDFIDIALIHGHYFKFEDTIYSSCFIKNYEVLKDVENPYNISRIQKIKNKTYYTKNDKQKINSLNMVVNMNNYFKEGDFSYIDECNDKLVL
jgi:hypothetical protein